MTHHALLDRMKTSIDTWETNGDRRAIFLACYALMTRNMLDGIDAGRFDDNGWVHRLVLHLQETFSDVVKTDKTGLSKTAHTRWMISAFANFLPGSTIFRLA